ncbi:DarT1-associated NADAR antitoxin family protein, partial [Staphylococcus simulans]
YNCQAEACAIYVSLVKRGLLKAALKNIHEYNKIVFMDQT